MTEKGIVESTYYKVRKRAIRAPKSASAGGALAFRG